MAMLAQAFDARVNVMWFWFWFSVALFVLAVAISVGKLIQRRVKRRKEYVGPPPAAEEIAYLAGGPDRAVRAALIARTTARPLPHAVAEAYAAGRLSSPRIVGPVRTAVDDLVRSLQERGLADAQGRATADGEAAVRDARDEYAPLWPGFNPDWATCGGDERAMAVAVFGDAVLDAIDPALAAAYGEQS